MYAQDQVLLVLALKKHRPNWDVFLVDISPEAIEECNINAKKNNLDVTIIQSDLFQELNNIKFDLIVSNPPYLDQNEVNRKICFTLWTLYSIICWKQWTIFLSKNFSWS
ncbi:methyltransferase [Mycoplasmopsis cynos]|uniref:methyltransferase n=1 Tax=Mycoplasmopsis cynos TaxID=171284 RepID=UPI0024C8918F|nr:methyltransferase [Mycoplasmopsis cynos]WAM05225.1 methyltransferase [Mycoplasmopsis cynos]